MRNELKTTFVFEDAQTKKVDDLHKKLLDVNNAFTNLGGSVVFGKTINQNTQVAGKSVDKLTTTIDGLDRKLLVSQKNALALANNFNKLGQNSLQKDALGILNRLREIDVQLAKKPNGSFLQKLESETKSLGRELAGLQRKLIDVREIDTQFQSIKKSITDSLTVPTDTPNKPNPNRPQLQPRPNSPNSTNTRLTPFQLQNLSYQVNDVLTGLASGQNPTQIIAQQSGQIAQIFNVAQISAFIAKYGTLVSVIGAGTVALTATYAITNQIRTLAEQRLKNEDLITGAINKQVLGLKSALTEYEKFKQSVLDARILEQNIQSGIDRLDATSIKDLQKRTDERNKSNITEINRLEAQIAQRERDLEFAKNRKINDGLSSELGLTNRFTAADQRREINQIQQDIERDRKQIAEAQNQLEKGKATFQRTVSALDSITANQDKLFAQRSDAYVKSQNDLFNAQQEAAQKAALEFAKSVEIGKEKVKELGKTYNELFDSLSLRSNQNNPFVLLYSEADKSLKSLRENSRGLSRDLISQFEALEQKANNLKLFDLRLNNNLAAFDLRDQAENFRNPFTPRPAEETKREQDKIIADYLRNNPNFLFLEGKTEVDEATRLKILNSSALGRASLETRNPFEPLQKRLEKQLEIIYSGNLSADELGIADRRFISLTNGLNPNELTTNLRQEAALAREREADRLERAEQEAKRQRTESLRVQEQIRDELRRLNELAEKEGIQGIIRIIDDTGGRVKTRLGKTPTENDTRRLFGQFID